MSIIIKNLTLKNFLSIGAVTQAVNFDRKDLTLILGENLDLGGDGARNGTGKCVCINTMIKIRNKNTGEISEMTIGELYEQSKKDRNNKQGA
jgi:hypothetical protein